MTLRFDEFARDLTYDDLSAEVRHVLRRSFLDTIGVAAVGSTTKMSAIARDVAPVLFGAGGASRASLLLDGRVASPAGAAMAGGFTIDSVDAHDGTTPCKGHAGAAVFPSLIAMVEAERSNDLSIDGTSFAAHLAVAYEVSYRAGLTQHATCPDYHTSGAWTSVGIGAAGARMLDGSKQTIRHAAGIGEYHGPRSQMMRCIDHPTMLRDGLGWGAACGVSAAYLANAGFTGAPALTCEGEDSALFWRDLGSAWRLLDHTHYKAYPCCRWAHPAIDAADELMQEYALHHSMIKRVEIKTFLYATRLAGHEPRTPDEFAYSIAFPVAAMIVRGSLGASELAEATLDDPDILRVSRATDLIDDLYLTEISTDKRWAQVSLILTDGRTVSSPPRTPRGDIEQPLSDDDLIKKFHMFADPVLGLKRAHVMKELCWNFDVLDTSEFVELIDQITTPVQH